MANMTSESADVIDFEVYRRQRDEQKAIEAARAIRERDSWLSERTRETQAFLEERRAYALGDLCVDPPVFDHTTFAVRAMDEEDDGA